MPQLEVTDRERKAYPTYDTAARVVEGNDLTSPIEFIAWTTIRSLLILPGMAMVGIRGKKLIFGALLGSAMVSTAALWRSYATKQAEIWAENRRRRALPARRTRARRRLPSRTRRR
ncbi:MAG: hypothetical protein JSV86_17080 [Gemmatimonadota bacterium]|nr:MAG: hypothetical protein JSV86_17080 [Gemmatimonadota bacterium]